MSAANPLWGAPRIHGELLKLGFTVSQTTVATYMVRRRPLPSQTWRTFLANHAQQLIAADFFVVPTVTCRLLFVLCEQPTGGLHVNRALAERLLQTSRSSVSRNCEETTACWRTPCSRRSRQVPRANEGSDQHVRINDGCHRAGSQWFAID
jgi:hypothetical protein